MQQYFGSWNATARIFFLHRLLSFDWKTLIITDHNSDYILLQTFARKIFPQKITLVETMSHFLSLVQDTSLEAGIFVMHPSILESQWTLHFLKKTHTLRIFQNENISIETLIQKLVDFWYTHDDALSQPFSYRRSGGVLSILQSNITDLYHVEWFDDEIDSILHLDTSGDGRNFISQISLQSPQKPEKDHELSPETQTLNLDLLPLLDFFENRIALGCDFLSYRKDLLEKMHIHISDFFVDNGQNREIEVPKVSEPRELIELLRKCANDLYTIDCYTKYKQSLKNFLEYNSLENIQIYETKNRHIQSFVDSKNRHALFADDIFGALFIKNRWTRSVAKNLDLLLSLLPWDLVVHRDHGIGRFIETVIKKTGEIEREYIKIEYRDEAFLFVPITEVYRVSKYLGDQNQKLAKLESKEWEQTMKQTDEEIQKVAEDLLQNNAKRKIAKGNSFWKFSQERRKFEKAFPYEYTPDQYKAIEDIHGDMEADTPMDRLLAWDVWFGKTEVAMNAIYKAVLSGYQVAFITPLVVLADEHYETCIRRFADFGIRIALLSRMSTPKQAKNILQKMWTWEVDLVIGTHRLLSEDIRWKRLGLLIIDEEHKFGVIHKEKIKKMRLNIDILSLSATPIPRSLNLALSWLRSMSILATPPKKRKPIDTIVSSWNPHTLRQAISAEVDRGGQVIIIFNRILGLQSIAQEVAHIVNNKKIKILTTHGRMNPGDIEEKIHDFKRKKYDVLITTTIIENWVNFLSANTICIVDPEDFGLASLHQLRGRVGRKDEQGYCYLMYRKWLLSESQKERLIMLANNNHLGAGFEIAMRDMEIRGAGEVLGIAQSGKTKHVGLSLYFRMLEEKVQQLKENRKKRPETKIDLDISYVLPDHIFLSQTDKLAFFREVELVESREELDQIRETMANDLENISQVTDFFVLLQARLTFQDFHIVRVSQRAGYFVFDFESGTSAQMIKNFLESFDPKKQMILVSMKKIKISKKYFSGSIDFLKHFS